MYFKSLASLAALKKVTMNFSPMLAVPHPQMDMFLITQQRKCGTILIS